MLSQLFRSARSSSRRTACIASCEWNTDDSFLIARLFPDRCAIPVLPGQHARDVLKRLPDDLRYFLFHINGTFTSEFFDSRQLLLECLHERGVTPLNASITDISKKLLQRICVENGLNSTLAPRDGDPAELLMVKTNLNYAGKVEAMLTPPQQRRLGLPLPSKLLESVLSRIQEYPVLPRREIPVDWWHEPQIIIERFVSNSVERFYRIHAFHDRLVVTDAITPGRVKKLSTHVKAVHHYFTYPQLDAGEAEPIFLELGRQTRIVQQKLRFDYAALDAVVDDSATPFLIDVNTTPWSGQIRLDHPLLEFLRSALA